MNEPLTQPMNDAMLTATRWILFILIGLILFSGIMMLIGIAALPFAAETVTRQITETFVNPNMSGALWLLTLLLAGVALLLFLSALFLIKLELIIRSAGVGDPFVLINAVRLRTMAYAALGVQGLVILVAVLATWLVTTLGDISDTSELAIGSDYDFSLTGLLLFFLLIILARIFERGADMREELEGTV